MPVTTGFQPCPVCGRGLMIPVECLGQQVACSHCCGRFQARDTSNDAYRHNVDKPTMMDRAEFLLGFDTSLHSNRLAAFPSFSE